MTSILLAFGVLPPWKFDDKGNIVPRDTASGTVVVMAAAFLIAVVVWGAAMIYTCTGVFK